MQSIMGVLRWLNHSYWPQRGYNLAGIKKKCGGGVENKTKPENWWLNSVFLQNPYVLKELMRVHLPNS